MWGRQAPTLGPEERVTLLWCTRASRRDGGRISCNRFHRAAAALAPQPFPTPPKTLTYPESSRCLGISSRRLEYLSVRGWPSRSVAGWEVELQSRGRLLSGNWSKGGRAAGRAQATTCSYTACGARASDPTNDLYNTDLHDRGYCAHLVSPKEATRRPPESLNQAVVALLAGYGRSSPVAWAALMGQ